MKNTKFYICPVCRNIVEMVYDTDIALYCCAAKMEELIPNTVEASGDKHIPVATVKGNVVEVCVGSVDHAESRRGTPCGIPPQWGKTGGGVRLLQPPWAVEDGTGIK